MNYYSRKRFEQKKNFSKKLSFIELLSHKSSMVTFIFEKFSKLRYLGLRNLKKVVQNFNHSIEIFSNLLKID